jgi:hypothetical protein
MPVHDHRNLSVSACVNAARSPFSLLADAYGRAHLHAHDGRARRSPVGGRYGFDGREAADAQGAGRAQAPRARPRGTRRFRLPRVALGSRAAFASIVVVLALLGGAVAALPF